MDPCMLFGFGVHFEGAMLLNCLSKVDQVSVIGVSDEEIMHDQCEVNVSCLMLEVPFHEAVFVVSCFC